MITSSRVLLPVILALLPCAAWADPPEVRLKEWKDAFAANPKLFQLGAHVVEKPEKAIVVTGRVLRKNLSFKTLDQRRIAEDIAELAAKKQLLDFRFRLDKANLKLPAHLERFANDSLLLDAHSGSLTIRGAQVAARWIDDDFLWCTLVVGEKGIEQAKEFSESFRTVGGRHFLKLFAKDNGEADLRRAFEIDGATPQVREQLVKHLLAKGCRVAAFLVNSPDCSLPGPDDHLGKFLLSVKDSHWDEGMRHFEAEKPDLEKALDGFLHALDTRYTDPDALNYLGTCLRELGWNRQASVFLLAAVKQSKNNVHRYALTNLGLSLLDLDRPGEARPYLQRAVAAFPEETWTQKARQALAGIDSIGK